MSATHEGPGFVEHVIRGVRMAVLLTCLTVLLHHFHPFGIDRMDHFFTAAVVSRLQAGEHEELRSEESKAGEVQLIELGADLRAMALEDRHPDAASVLRLDGVRPLDRAALARLLNSLADCLYPLSPRACTRNPALERMPAVLAIDMDLAPLVGDDEKKRRTMLDALTALRRHVQVVVIALERPEGKERQQRNDFIKLSHCTRLSEPDPPGLKGLFFASPWLLLRPQEGPLQYLTRPTPTQEREQGDAWFPGLGTLARLAAQRGSESPERASASLRTLTQYCELIHENKPLREDGLADQGAPGTLVQGLQKRYHSSYFNWPLLNSEALRFSPLYWSDSGAERDWDDQALGQLSAHQLQAPILMLAVDAGGSNDKFQTPGAMPRPVTGATLHALQTLSIQRPLQEASWQGFVADLALGALLVLVSCTLHLLLLHPLQHRMPMLTSLMGALLALALVGGFNWLGQVLAAVLMSRCGLWFNPLYVLVGLTLHAYAEGWSRTPEKRFKGSAGQLVLSLLKKPASGAGADAWFIFVLQWSMVAVAGYLLLLPKH